MRKENRKCACIGLSHNAERGSHASIYTVILRKEYQFANSFNKMDTVIYKSNVFTDIQSRKMWVQQKNKSRARITKEDFASWVGINVYFGMNTKRKSYARIIYLGFVLMDPSASMCM